MKYLIIICLMIAGCATTKTISTQDYSSLQKELLSCLAAAYQPAIEESLAKIDLEEASKGAPPYTWPPESCNDPTHVWSWPNYEKTKTAECTWFFHPLDRDHSTCVTRWSLSDSKWIQVSLSCTEHENY